MACYNRMKAESRKQEIADREAEVVAIDKGKWPRDIDDDMRWGPNKTFHDVAEKATYARKMCYSALAYLKAIPSRIECGDLPGWEM